MGARPGLFLVFLQNFAFEPFIQHFSQTSLSVLKTAAPFVVLRYQPIPIASGQLVGRDGWRLRFFNEPWAIRPSVFAKAP